MPGWNADLSVGSYDHVLKASIFTDSRDGRGNGVFRGRRSRDMGKELVEVRRELCEQWVEHPVLIQQRDTFANFFHDR